MSLKAFHFVFIFFSTLLAAGCGVWCIWIYLTQAAPAYIEGAITSFVIAAGFIVYGVWFYRKMKRSGLMA